LGFKAAPKSSHFLKLVYQFSIAALYQFTSAADSLPEVAPGLRESEEMAVVPVPEAAMNKNSCTVLRENNIRRPGEGFDVQTETESERKKKLAYQ
jgi:hypothetical protein